MKTFLKNLARSEFLGKRMVFAGTPEQLSGSEKKEAPKKSNERPKDSLDVAWERLDSLIKSGESTIRSIKGNYESEARKNPKSPAAKVEQENRLTKLDNLINMVQTKVVDAGRSIRSIALSELQKLNDFSPNKSENRKIIADMINKDIQKPETAFNNKEVAKESMPA